MIPQSACVLVLSKPPEPAVARCLAVTNRAHGGFGLPGGKVEPGETFEMAAIRELAEETNLRVGEDRLVADYTAVWSFQRLDGPGPEREVRLLRALGVAGTPRANEAGTELKWLAFEELLAYSPFADFYRKAMPFGFRPYVGTRMQP